MSFLQRLLLGPCRRWQEHEITQSTPAAVLPPANEQALPHSNAAQSAHPAAPTGSRRGTDSTDSTLNEANEPQQPMLSEEEANEGQTEAEVTEEIQARLPGANWRERIGAAGTSVEQQRVSPIVELSMLLVRTT